MGKSCLVHAGAALIEQGLGAGCRGRCLSGTTSRAHQGNGYSATTYRHAGAVGHPHDQRIARHRGFHPPAQPFATSLPRRVPIVAEAPGVVIGVHYRTYLAPGKGDTDDQGPDPCHDNCKNEQLPGPDAR